ncbi:MAG: hypothetical protein CMN73_08470 [Sphingomonas sp.]|nr:hypothetical protein [Sphingomonas sp.]
MDDDQVAATAGVPETSVTVGEVHGVRFTVAGEDSPDAEAELLITGLFAHHPPDQRYGGALGRLDEALRGALHGLGRDHLFAGQRGETLLLSAPPASIAARAVLLVGLGELDDWNTEAAAAVAASAMRETLLLGVASVRFAPWLQDGGLTAAATRGTAAAMLAGARRMLEARPRGAPPPILRQWIFAPGLEWRDVTIQELRGAPAA